MYSSSGSTGSGPNCAELVGSGNVVPCRKFAKYICADDGVMCSGMVHRSRNSSISVLSQLILFD